MNQIAEKISMPLNRMRSAKAPTINAGVMIAKVIWKATNSGSGIVPESESTVMPLRKSRSVPPMTDCSPPPLPK